jgi:phosphatidylglycerophosphatase A
VPAAPGTCGTLLAFALYWPMRSLGVCAFLGVTAGFFLLGVWACGVTGRALGAHDHAGMVWDETVAFLLVLFFTPVTLPWQAAAFLLFRFFDILKPPPIRHCERRLRGGFGVMLDDLVAAFYTLLVLAVAARLLEGG